jgi:hypothetical protein
MKPENKSTKSPEELEPLRGSDAVIDFMLRQDLPLTRDVYVGLAFDQPEPELGAEELATIPSVFRQQDKL